jgi:MFS superfamily sulfate permease-like transporter
MSGSELRQAQLLATFISGLILLAIGLLRLGTFIKYIPYPMTVGFTAGIAIIIFASRIKDLLGLTLPAPSLERSFRSSPPSCMRCRR